MACIIVIFAQIRSRKVIYKLRERLTSTFAAAFTVSPFTPFRILAAKQFDICSEKKESNIVRSHQSLR